MHRVLSFQMARGFGESSEFVTKRMCFSFLFCVGFLSLLGGFLLGRFAAERNVEMRAEKKRLELAGNGLESTGYLQDLLQQKLQQASFDHRYAADTEETESRDADILGIKEVLSNFKLFHEIVQTRTGLIATVRGSREPDRWVVLSASGEGINLAIELARIFDNLRSEHDWEPRRTLMFCIVVDVVDFCHETIPKHVRPKVVAYLAVHGNAVRGNGRLAVSGSNIVESTVLESAGTVQNPNAESYAAGHRTVLDEYKKGGSIISPRLPLDLPHARLSFVDDGNSSSTGGKHEDDMTAYSRGLAQVVGVSMWRLSDSVVLRWDAKDLNHVVKSAVEIFYAPQFQKIKDEISTAIKELMGGVESLNKKIDIMERTNSLDVRMINDELIDLDRALLCPGRDMRSKTDLAVLQTLSHESTVIIAHLKEMHKCYESSLQVLQET